MRLPRCLINFIRIVKKNYLLKILCFVLLIGSSFSCSSDLNFDQVNDLKLKPVVVGNFSYFDIPASSFVTDNGSEYNWVYDDEEFDVFRDKYFNSYLQRADFYFEINNTISRAFVLNINLYDENDAILTTIAFNIPAYSGSTNVIKRTEIFENARLDLLKRTRKMSFFMTLVPGAPLNQNSPGNLVLRSSATVYLEIQ